MLLRGMYIALYYRHLDFVWSTWFWRPGWILLLFKSSWKIGQYLFNVKQVTFLNLLLLPPFKNVDFCCWNWNLGNWCGPLMTGGTSARECGREPPSPLRHLPRAVPHLQRIVSLSAHTSQVILFTAMAFPLEEILPPIHHTHRKLPVKNLDGGRREGRRYR